MTHTSELIGENRRTKTVSAISGNVKIVNVAEGYSYGFRVEKRKGPVWYTFADFSKSEVENGKFKRLTLTPGEYKFYSKNPNDPGGGGNLWLDTAGININDVVKSRNIVEERKD